MPVLKHRFPVADPMFADLISLPHVLFLSFVPTIYLVDSQATSIGLDVRQLARRSSQRRIGRSEDFVVIQPEEIARERLDLGALLLPVCQHLVAALPPPIIAR